MNISRRKWLMTIPPIVAAGATLTGFGTNEPVVAAARGCQRSSGAQKRLVVCLDGTWNTAKDETNIDWIAKNVLEANAEPMPQHAHYVEGVGTRRWERTGGGLSGYGLSEQILDGYEFIRCEWQQGDELFIFGFSRGAYAARSLASFIGLVGRLDGNVDPRMIYDGWYKNAGARAGHPGSEAKIQRARAAVQGHSEHVDVTFLGVFDTVGALSAPSELGFHDIKLGPHIKNAYHALAIDEEHTDFEPDLWETVPDDTKAQQVWFAGGHGDVGGGHAGAKDNRTLAKVPLLWMMQHAADAGLVLEPEALKQLRQSADPMGAQHVAPPNIGRISAVMGKGPREIPENAVIHPAVQQRVGKLVKRRDSDGAPVDEVVYTPSNLQSL